MVKQCPKCKTWVEKENWIRRSIGRATMGLECPFCNALTTDMWSLEVEIAMRRGNGIYDPIKSHLGGRLITYEWWACESYWKDTSLAQRIKKFAPSDVYAEGWWRDISDALDKMINEKRNGMSISTKLVILMLQYRLAAVGIKIYDRFVTSQKKKVTADK